MRQQSLSATGFEKYQKQKRRARFLSEMDQVVPWAELAAVIEPYYPAPMGPGRRPVCLERMLRIYFLQHWFNLSDPAVEETPYDSNAMRDFVGIDLGREPAPDETTVCKFRHMMEKNDLGTELFHAVGEYLEENGLKVHKGTIVDATIINAPSSTKNQKKERDPEMHQTKKGNQWYFGMKAHIGVDSKTNMVHLVAATAANTHDSQVLEDLLHGDETRVWGDSAYSEQKATLREAEPSARDSTQKKGNRHRPLSEADRKRNRTKSKVRAKVEHPFHVMKRVFQFSKVRYRGLAKNANHVFASCALINLFMARRRLLALLGD